MMIPSMPRLTGSRDFRVKGGPTTICGYYDKINNKLIVKDPNPDKPEPYRFQKADSKFFLCEQPYASPESNPIIHLIFVFL